MSNLIAMTVAGSVIVGLMLLFRPATVKIFPATWQYRIGMTAIAFFLIPVSSITEKLSSVWAQTITPSHYSRISPMAIPGTVQSNNLADAMDSLTESHLSATTEKYLSFEGMQMILCIWFVGAIVFAAWHFYCYRRFIMKLRTNNTSASEDAAVLLSSCKAALKIPGEVKLMQNNKITSPMLVGIFRPMILLPASNMQENDLKLILNHELTHLKRKDLWIKMFALAAGMLHWFNPFVYVLRKDISRWSELSCDEVLAAEMSYEERKLYGAAILNTLDMHSGIDTTFCSSLSGNRKQIEKRLTMILNIKKSKKNIAVLAVAAILAICSTGMTLAAKSAEIINDNVANVNVEKTYHQPDEKTYQQPDVNIDRELTESGSVEAVAENSDLSIQINDAPVLIEDTSADTISASYNSKYYKVDINKPSSGKWTVDISVINTNASKTVDSSVINTNTSKSVVLYIPKKKYGLININITNGIYSGGSFNASAITAFLDNGGLDFTLAKNFSGTVDVSANNSIFSMTSADKYTNSNVSMICDKDSIGAAPGYFNNDYINGKYIYYNNTGSNRMDISLCGGSLGYLD